MSDKQEQEEVGGVAATRKKVAPVTAEQHREALEEDWSQWRATQDIYYDGALAYAGPRDGNPGHPVPHANVLRHGYHEQGLVEKTNDDGTPVEAEQPKTDKE